jgi:hypothetical protein
MHNFALFRVDGATLALYIDEDEKFNRSWGSNGIFKHADRGLRGNGP